jgi:hypothetical protein
MTQTFLRWCSAGNIGTGGTVAKPNQPLMSSGAARMKSRQKRSTRAASSIGQKIGPP